MIDTLMLEKKYYELMGYRNITVIEDEAGCRWLEYGDSWEVLPTICWSTEQVTKVMLLHKINVRFHVQGVSAWHDDRLPLTTYYHTNKNTRAYFSDDEVFNVAVLQAAVDLLERKGK